MKRWKVTIIETLTKTIEIQAYNAEEAEDKDGLGVLVIKLII